MERRAEEIRTRDKIPKIPKSQNDKNDKTDKITPKSRIAKIAKLLFGEKEREAHGEQRNTVTDASNRHDGKTF